MAAHFWMCAHMLSHVCATPWTIAPQAPLSMGSLRQEYCSGLPFPSPGDLPHPGSQPPLLRLLHWQAGFLPLHHLGCPLHGRAGLTTWVHQREFIHRLGPGQSSEPRLGARAAVLVLALVRDRLGSHVLPPVPQNFRGREQKVLVAGLTVVGLLQGRCLLEGLGGSFLRP